MAQWHGVSKRKRTGGRRTFARGKRKFEIASEKQLAFVGEGKRKHYRIRGKNKRVRILAARSINVSDSKTGKSQVAKIQTVVESPANPNYVRRNVLTRGSVVETDLGLVRVTSRPGQHGVLNGERL